MALQPLPDDCKAWFPEWDNSLFHTEVYMVSIKVQQMISCGLVWVYPAARHIGGDTLKMLNLHDEKYWPSSNYPNFLDAENLDKHFNGNL